MKQVDKFQHCIVSADDLQTDGNELVGAFKVCGFDCGVPAVLKQPMTVLQRS